ncbi:MAG: division/cell wall cluster transcriptional repressor MraZ [Candidatus Dormibacteraceae bacterium]
MFSGTYRVRVDVKGRLAIPIRFREQLPSGSFISIGPEMVLAIYPPAEWDSVGARLPSPLGATSEQRAIARAVHSMAVACEFDGQGRVMLSQEQRRVAGLETSSTVAVIGAGAVVEIWPEARWDSYSGDALSRFTDTVNRVIQGL